MSSIKKGLKVICTLVIIGLTFYLIHQFFSLEEPKISSYSEKNEEVQIVLEQFHFPHNADLMVRVNGHILGINYENISKMELISWPSGEYTPLTGFITGIFLPYQEKYEFFKSKNEIYKRNYYSESPLIENIYFWGDSLYYPFDVYEREFAINIYDNTNSSIKLNCSNFDAISLDRTLMIQTSELTWQNGHGDLQANAFKLKVSRPLFIKLYFLLLVFVPLFFIFLVLKKLSDRSLVTNSIIIVFSMWGIREIIIPDYIISFTLIDLILVVYMIILLWSIIWKNL